MVTALKAILLVVGGLVFGNIVWATFIADPPGQMTFVTDNAATKQGQDPWMVNEKRNVGVRERSRLSALKTLERPWAEFCTSDGRKSLIAAVNGYYSQRETIAWSYGNTYGEEARRFAMSQWQTPADNRIERLMSETYGRGYFSLDDLKSYARKPIADLTKGMKVYPNPCAS